MPRIIPEPKDITGGGGGGGGFQTTFVYKPGGTAVDNVYTNWASLYSDLTSVPGPKIVQIDDSITSPALIPSGIYDLSDTLLIGSSEIKGAYPIMQLQDGAVFSNLEQIQFLEIYGNSTSPSFVISSAKQIFLTDVEMRVLSGQSPIFESSSSFEVVLTRTLLEGTEPIFDILSGTTSFYVENQSQIGQDLINSSIGTIVDFFCVDSNVSINTQSGILGTTSTSNLSDAAKIFYDNTTSGLIASDVQAAIDELATSSFADKSNFGFSRTLKVPNPGTLYLKYHDVVSSVVGVPVTENIILHGGAVIVDVADTTNNYNLEFLVNGIVRETISLTSGNTFAFSTSFSYNAVNGDNISARWTRTTGTGPSDFSDTNVVLIYRNT